MPSGRCGTPWDLTQLLPPDASPAATTTIHYTPNPSKPPPLPVSLTPPPPISTPPSIFHIISPRSVIPSESHTPPTLKHFILRHTPLSATLIDELLHFGAVYVRACPPSPRVSPKPRRAVDGNITLPLNVPVYVRVYAIPKRHVAHTKLRIISSETDHLLIVCKPAGLPMAPSVDNLHECLVHRVTHALDSQISPSTHESHPDLARGVFVTTRLDVGTSGLVVLCTSRSLVPEINRMLSQARKTYMVRLCTHVTREPCGTVSNSEGEPALRIEKWVDWYNNAARLARGVCKHRILHPFRADACVPEALGNEKWVRAELNVVDVRFIAPSQTLQHSSHSSLCDRQGWWQVKVQLVTGRTHQIRLQFAARGFLVAGDIKYARAVGNIYPCTVPDADAEGPVLGRDATCLGLHACRIQGTWRGNDTEWVSSIEDRGGWGVGLCHSMPPG